MVGVVVLASRGVFEATLVEGAESIVSEGGFGVFWFCCTIFP
jgi:hypothetical protein